MLADIDSMSRIKSLIDQAQNLILNLHADAARYQWLRKHIEIRDIESVSGTKRPALFTAVGGTFLDSFRYKRDKK